jgi:hypothetical protein
MVNGASVYQATLANGKQWLPAISIGGEEAGDLSASINFGQNRFDILAGYKGWYRKAPGLPTIRVALSNEAFLGLVDGQKRPFSPGLLNGRSAPIRRAPMAWFQGSSKASSAAITTLRFDNSKGDYNALLAADIRDADFVLSVIDSPDRGYGDYAKAATIFTGVVDTVSAPKVSEVEISLRDTLSRLDRPLPCRVVPPFYDESSAGHILPIGIGAQRNVQPLLLDKPNRIFALGDAPMSNVTEVSDQAAPLDPYASPAQYVPALAGAAIQLDTSPQGRLAVDCSSIGQQWVIPGAIDILEGDGQFDTWDSSGIPEGWDLPSTSNGSIVHTSAPGYADVLQISSSTPYTPTGGRWGFQVHHAEILEPGTTYRFTFKLVKTLGGNNGDPAFKYGFAILAGHIDSAAYWVTPFRDPLTVPFQQQNFYTYTYTVPRDAIGNLPIILTCIPFFGGSAPSPLSALAQIANLKVERLGQFVQAPLDGITVKDAFTEILVNRAGEDPSIFSASDCDAIDAATGYSLGFRYTDVPNILNVLGDIADQVGAAIFTDANGVIRIRRLTNPDEGTPVARFTEANVISTSVQRTSDEGDGFTALGGARPNCVPFGAGDFVTDTVTVDSTIRARYQGLSQYLLSVTSSIAQQYQSAKTKARKILRIDDLAQAQSELDRIAEEQFSSKAILLTFEAKLDSLMVGDGVSCAAHEIYYADVVTLDLPALGLSEKNASVLSTAPNVGGGSITLTVRYTQ